MSSSTPVAGLVEEAVTIREYYRSLLASVRMVTEETQARVTTSFNMEDLLRIAKLNKEMMALFLGFIEAGGRVLGVPLYDNNCRRNINNTITTRIRKRAIVELQVFRRYYPATAIPASLAHEQPMPGVGLYYQVYAIKKQDGAIKHLQRLADATQQNGADIRIWRWVFADMLEDETVDTLVREQHRWGFAGWFMEGIELEKGGGFGTPYVQGHPDNVFTLT